MLGPALDLLQLTALAPLDPFALVGLVDPLLLQVGHGSRIVEQNLARAGQGHSHIDVKLARLLHRYHLGGL